MTVKRMEKGKNQGFRDYFELLEQGQMKSWIENELKREVQEVLKIKGIKIHANLTTEVLSNWILKMLETFHF